MKAWISLGVLAATLGGVGGCRSEPAPVGPADVLVEFIQTMTRVHGDPAVGARAVELLWQPARDNLKERARRASALSGREIAPGEMLAPSWFSLHLVPDRYETRLDGDWAEITVTSRDGRSLKTRSVLENGQWKVALELPELSAIRQRPNVEDEDR